MTMTLADRTLDLAISIQQIPAPTPHETQRAAYLRERFMEENLAAVEIDDIGNVYACIPGTGTAAPLIVTAHSDTVFPASTDLTIKREEGKLSGPGIGDNSMGVAGLFGLRWSLQAQEVRLPGDLWLVANVGEEGLGNLRGMKAVADRFGEGALAYIVLEGMALGQVYHRGLGIKRYRISVKTKGGHSWVDYGRPSAIHELAAVVNSLTDIPMRTDPRTTLNVGIISGGTSINSIASQASLQLDLRSEGADGLRYLNRKVEKIVQDANNAGVEVSIETIGHRPGGEIPATHPLVSLAVQSLEDLGVQPILNIGSTDANVPLSRGLPAITIGLTNGGSAHSIEEYLYTEPLKIGLAHVTDVVVAAFRILA
jgi:acetylornithine deacetylase/succinyl-diaminopimelate desuccinylase-like protein